MAARTQSYSKSAQAQSGAKYPSLRREDIKTGAYVLGKVVGSSVVWRVDIAIPDTSGRVLLESLTEFDLQRGRRSYRTHNTSKNEMLRMGLRLVQAAPPEGVAP